MLNVKRNVEVHPNWGKIVKYLVEGDNKYIHFELYDIMPKTEKWLVINKSSCEPIGLIEWYHWRQYVFMPEPQTVFNNGCLQSIIDFVNELNDKKKLVPADKETGRFSGGAFIEGKR